MALAKWDWLYVNNLWMVKMKKGFLLFSNRKTHGVLSRSRGILTCGVATVFLLLFTQSSIAAASSQSDFPEHSQNCTANWKLAHPSAVCTKSSSFSLNSSELGWKGPVSFSTTYSSLLGLIYNAHLIKTLGSNTAIAGLVNYGNNELRLNATWAYQLMKANRVKITYEYLDQKLGFDFATGKLHKWVGQNAVGLEDQQYFRKGILNSLGLKLQYIRANSVKLNPILFRKNGEYFLNYRNIAGGDEAILNARVGLLPNPHVKLEFGTGISTLKYRTIYQPYKRTTGLDGLASIHVIATPKTMFSLSANHTVSSTDLTGKITRLLSDEFATSLMLSNITGNNGARDNNAITLSLSFPASSHFSNYSREAFAEPLKAWVSQPAVEMSQVLAIKDSKVVGVVLHTVGIPNQEVLTDGFMVPIHTANYFSWPSGIFNSVDYTFTVSSSDTSHQQIKSANTLTLKTLGLEFIKINPYEGILKSVKRATTANLGTYTITIKAHGIYNGKVIEQKSDQFYLSIKINRSLLPAWNTNLADAIATFDVGEVHPPIKDLSTYVANPPGGGALHFSLTPGTKNVPSWVHLTDIDGKYGLTFTAPPSSAAGTNTSFFVNVSNAQDYDVPAYIHILVHGT